VGFIISAFALTEHRCNEYSLIVAELQTTYTNRQNDNNTVMARRHEMCLKMEFRNSGLDDTSLYCRLHLDSGLDTCLCFRLHLDSGLHDTCLHCKQHLDSGLDDTCLYLRQHYESGFYDNQVCN
jgi:hypothetical protein